MTGEEFWGSSRLLMFFNLLWKGIYVDGSQIALLAAYLLMSGWVVRAIEGYLTEWTLYLRLAVFWCNSSPNGTSHVFIGHYTLVIGCWWPLVRSSECWWTLSLHKCTLMIGLVVITSTDAHYYLCYLLQSHLFYHPHYNYNTDRTYSQYRYINLNKYYIKYK